MNYIQLLSLIMSFPMLVNAQQKADNGVFVYTVWTRHSVTGAMSVLLRDTIFIYNRLGIEKVMKSEDPIVNNKVTTSSSLETYYRINFDKYRFQDIGKNLIYRKEADLPFTTPKMGLNFSRKLYNGEKHTATDTTINHKYCKVIRYVGNSNNSLSGAHITLILSDVKSKVVHLIPSIEDTFNGRLLRFEATDDKDGRIVMVLEHLPQLSDYWKKIISRQEGIIREDPSFNFGL